MLAREPKLHYRLQDIYPAVLEWGKEIKVDPGYYE